ncbi:MAG: hypothetical protein AAF153_00915 [Pseudomonadota bacterium]
MYKLFDVGELQLKLSTTETGVLDLALELAEMKQIGIDTEFDRRYTYLPIPSLLQIANHSTIWVVDVYKNKLDLAPLKNIWRDESIKKIFHAGDQDIAILNHLLKCRVTNTFDTQLAAQALGISNQISYEELVAKKIYFNFTKAKQQRSDWLKRPLYEKQIMYAADDVRYLIDLYQLLDHEIKKSNRDLWLAQKLKQQQQSSLFRVPEQDWIKYAPGNANERQLCCFKQLFIWRELTAVKLNKPTSHLVDTSTLIELALGKVVATQLSPHKYEQDILASILDIIDIAETGFISNQELQQLRQRCLTRTEQDHLKQCKQVIRSKAKELGIAANFLTNRDELQQFVVLASINQASKSPIMNDWRKSLFGQELLLAISQTSSADHYA